MVMQRDPSALHALNQQGDMNGCTYQSRSNKLPFANLTMRSNYYAWL